MAIYDNLPVFKASYDLLIEVYEMCDKLPREYRHTLGERLKNDITELMIRIYRANAAMEKMAIILSAREYMVTIKLYIRLLHDLRQLSVKRYALLAEKSETISKQLAAWCKGVEKKRLETEKKIIEGKIPKTEPQETL